MPKCHELWSTNCVKLDRHFTHPMLILLLRHCQASQTEIANRSQPYFAKRRTVNRANNFLYNSWGRPAGKNGGQKLLHLFGFSTTSTLSGEYLLMKRDINNWARVLESTKGLLHCLQISLTLVHKRLKMGPNFLPTLTIFFVPVHRTASNWH